jgi:hypothetical protein
MSVKNVDNVLIPIQNELIAELSGKVPIKPESVELQPDESYRIKSEAEIDDDIQSEQAKLNQENSLEKVENDSDYDKIEQVTEKKSRNVTKSENLDEYGNEISAPKMYTQEEVQRMIQDRLSRGQYAKENQQNTEVRDAARDFTPDTTSDDSWEVQLEQFIDKTLEKRTHREENARYREREQQIQSEFETKFTSGMQRYQDFPLVVKDQPITDSMMLATRGFDDPAAFIYTACKNHGKEIERIAKIKDPFQQGAEIGKLEERMRKNRNVSSASKPITKVSGDVSDKVPSRPSIDLKIQQHARSRFRR